MAIVMWVQDAVYVFLSCTVKAGDISEDACSVYVYDLQAEFWVAAYGLQSEHECFIGIFWVCSCGLGYNLWVILFHWLEGTLCCQLGIL